jgi:carbonic anhydrase
MHRAVFVGACAAVVLAISGSALSQEPPEWSYGGSTGPAHWSSLSPAFAACGEGERQSPINLRNAHRQAGPAIRTDYTPSRLTEFHDGKTIEVSSDAPQTLNVGDTAYELAQFHFHAPSEHLRDGKAAPLELHFVHQVAGGERAVLAVLVQEGRRNRAFAQLAAAFPASAGEKTRVEASVDLTRLFPASRRAYRYAGSLTTPPCTEGIRWLVLARPITVSPRQLEQLERVVEGNARPVQPRNGRRLVLD